MKNDKGFTLVEVMIVIGILSFVMLALGSLLIGNIRSTKHVRDISETQQDAEIVMTSLRENTYDASKITVTDLSGSDLEDESEVTFGTANTNYSSASVYPSGYINLTRTGYNDFKNKKDKYYEEIKYKIFDKKFALETDKGSSKNVQVLASNVESITFKALPESSTFKNCTGVEVCTVIKKEDDGAGKSAQVSNRRDDKDQLICQYYFRNVKYK